MTDQLELTRERVKVGRASIASVTPVLPENTPEEIYLTLSLEHAMRLKCAIERAIERVFEEEMSPGGAVFGAVGLRVRLLEGRLVVEEAAAPMRQEINAPPIDLDELLDAAREDTTEEDDAADPVQAAAAREAPATKKQTSQGAIEHAPAEAVEPEAGAVATAAPPAEPAKPPAPTLDEAVEVFLRRFPNGFLDPGFVENERNKRWAAHQLFMDSLGGDRGDLLLAAGDRDSLIDAVTAVLHKAEILSERQVSVLADSLMDNETGPKFFRALFVVASDFDPSQRTFKPYFKAVHELASGSNPEVASWPVATALPHLARPDQLAVFDPVRSRRMAERMAYPLNFSPEPGWMAYAALLRMCDVLSERLCRLGARDMLDVCTFVSVVEK